MLHVRAEAHPGCRAELEGLKQGKDIFHEDWCATTLLRPLASAAMLHQVSEMCMPSRASCGLLFTCS